MSGLRHVGEKLTFAGRLRRHTDYMFIISHRAHGELREARLSHDTPQIAYLAPIGAFNHAARDCVWERF